MGSPSAVARRRAAGIGASSYRTCGEVRSARRPGDRGADPTGTPISAGGLGRLTGYPDYPVVRDRGSADANRLGDADSVREGMETLDPELDGRRRPRTEALLPHDWRDLLRQIAIWVGFVLGYQIARGLADRGSDEAFRNARRLIRLEERLGGVVELGLQEWALATGSGVVHALNWTYWFAQFGILSVALFWVYVRRNDAYPLLRNILILTNALGLVVYVALPTAPPRLFPELGFVDTLARSEALNHGSGVVELAANPYAAMPSLHAADALIVGVALAALVRNPLRRGVFLLYPLWVWFSLLATANHFWVDLAAGTVLALVGAALAWRWTIGGRTPVSVHADRPQPDTRGGIRRADQASFPSPRG